MAQDTRIPPPTTPIDSIYLLSSDGYKEHYLTLLSRFPARHAKLLVHSRAARLATKDSVLPEDAVERALERGVLRWWSDGPRGGIWILSPTSPNSLELITILVEEMEVLRLAREAGGTSGWELLGEGRRGSEGYVYLLHPPGRGGVDYENKKGGKEEGAGNGGRGAERVRARVGTLGLLGKMIRVLEEI